MIEWVTFACQLWVLVMLIGITWMNWQTRKLVNRMTELIGQYRREIAWLEARLEQTEQGKQSQKVTSSK